MDVTSTLSIAIPLVVLQYSITREECDEYAARSQMLWGAGHASGAFAEEMASVEVKTKKGPKVSWLGIFRRFFQDIPFSRTD